MADELLEGLVDTLGRAERGGTAGEDLREIATRYLQKARREGYFRRSLEEKNNAEKLGTLEAQARSAFVIVRKERRPREVPDPHDGNHVKWTIRDGEVRPLWAGSWNRIAVVPTTERITLWADLLANPTHEVEVEE